MKAVIMAGGEGTRLRPLTCGLPKPMVPILDKPVMEHIINHVKSFDIKDVAVTMAYMPSVITDYFGDGSDCGVNISYYTEEVPLGTGGSVKNAEDFLDDTFVIISGDAMTDIDLQQAIDFHRLKKSKATLVLKKVDTPLEYGVIITDQDGKIIRFLEKPSWGEVFSDTINTGIYILEPEVLDYYKKGDNFDFSKDLFPKLLRDNIPMYGYVSEAYWNDIGDLKVYKEVNFDILHNKVKINDHYSKVREGIWIGKNCNIHSTCVMIPPVFIGNNCIIKENTVLAEAVIGDHCEIHQNATIKRSILWDNTVVQSYVQCRGAVLCNGVKIKNGVSIFENSVIGSKTVVASRSVIKPEVKIWPEKNIEADTVVNQSLVWGTKVSKTLFGFKGISGDINTEITPEFASRLASAYGSTLKDGAKIVISTDGSNAAAAVKESISAGMMTTGIEILDIHSAALPINRYAVKFYKAEGGIHIRLDCEKNSQNRIHIELIDKTGANIDRNTERKIENVYVREDFKRCSSDKIRKINNLQSFVEYYLQSCINSLKNKSSIEQNTPKVIIASRSEHTLGLMASYLRSLGCRVDLDTNNFLDYEAQNNESNLNDYLRGMCNSVKTTKSDFAAVLSEDGESAILIDDLGRVIDRNKYLALSALIIMNSDTEKKIIIPYNATNAIDVMANSYNYEVVRTKNVPAELMKEMMKSDTETTPLQYIMNFDSIWGIGILLDYLTSRQLNLSDIVNMLPDFHMNKREVNCDWRHKGRLIREVIEENKNSNIELFEGVKINDERGWVLILPDSEKPVCNVFTEGYSEEYAKELCDIYSTRIQELLSHYE